MFVTLGWLAAALAAEPVRVRVTGGAPVYAAAADVIIATAPTGGAVLSTSRRGPPPAASRRWPRPKSPSPPASAPSTSPR
jgi:hypothetical protein